MCYWMHLNDVLLHLNEKATVDLNYQDYFLN